VIYVAFNMAVCSVVFAPWAQPRETISGLLGRWLETETGVKRIFASMAGLVVDAIYFWEVDHCRGVFHVERDARKVLYP